MRHGGHGRGAFSGDFAPPAPWRLFGIKLRAVYGHDTERTVGSLTDAELAWVGRVVLAECQARDAAKNARKERQHAL